MLKKAFATLFLLLNTTVVLADIVPYAGLELGLNNTTWQVTNTFNSTTNFSSTGAIGGAYAGIGTAVNQNIYAGLEAFFDESSAETNTKQMNTSAGQADVHVRARYNYGASFLPGLIIGNGSLLYTRLGFTKTRFVFNQSVVPAGSSSNNDYHNTTGGQIGLGLQGKVAKFTALRAEYDYTCYRNFTSFTNKTSVRDNQFKIGLTYILE